MATPAGPALGPAVGPAGGPALGPASWRLASGAALFAVVVSAVPLTVTADRRAVLCLLGIAAVWVVASVVDRHPASPAWTVTLAEGVLIGVLAGCAGSTATLAALAVPPFRAGLRIGLRGFAAGLALELAGFLAATWLVFGPMTSDYGVACVSWLLIALGLGLIGSYHRSTTQPADPLAPHRAAQALLRELLDLSDQQTSFDAVALGSGVVETVREELPVTAVAVHVPRHESLTPVTSAGTVSDDVPMTEVAHRSWLAAAPQVHGQAFAFPLMSEDRVVGVVSGLLPSRLDPQDLVLSGQLAALSTRLEAVALQLDTAMMFGRLRDTATSEERRRLAREIHDGVAQDIVSLGYLVDALAAAPASPEQAERLGALRRRITGVVAEVRRSVQTLRTDAGASESLGSAVSTLARHLSESASIPIRVTVDEGTVRLRPEVESEVLRIAQEAMTNAVRHAQPTAVEVLVRVAAPAAEIVVRDDGHGLRAGRSDSHGLSIMRERAALVDGELEISGVFPHGTQVRLRIGRARASSTSVAGDGTVVR